MIWAADFETTTSTQDCRVWAWACAMVENPEHVEFGTSIDSFMEFCNKHEGTYYFHNLAFDGEFILNWLLKHGYTHTNKQMNRSIQTVISAMGKWYEMTVIFEKKAHHKARKAVFKDSLKKLPMSVDSISKAFKLPISKLSIDYSAPRPIGHVLTDEEKEYVKHDVQIVAKALSIQFDQGLTKLTVGSDALTAHKESIGKDKWRAMFPVLPLDVDEWIRTSYRGGWTYCNPIYQSVGDREHYTVGRGSVYDVNSLYPSVMYNCPLPYGEPVKFEGKYEYNQDYPLYIQRLKCLFKVRENSLPCLQIKKSPFFKGTEYVTDSKGVVEITLTSVDWDMLIRQYDVSVLEWCGGYMFKSRHDIFTAYIDKWMSIKEQSEGGIRQLAKLMLNSLYGKFGTNPDVTQKIPFLKEDGSVGYKLGEEETRNPVYIPLAAFVTAWARYMTITACQLNYDRFLYSDTDSFHVLGCEPVVGIDVHPTHLGAWKHESNFDKGKYLRAKTYMERIVEVGKVINDVYQMVNIEPYIDVKCAGLPNSLKAGITFENFKQGLEIFGKLVPVHADGGVVLEERTFTIK